MMELAVVGEGDKSFDAAVLMVQQQIATYNEGTNKKLQKIEELVKVAMEKMNLPRQMKAKETGRRYINSFGWEAKVKNDTTMQPSFISNASHQLESRISKTRGTKVIDFSEDSKHQEFKGEPMSGVAYIREPIYDEELGAGQECWPEEEFILAALNRGNLDMPNPLQSEICRSGDTVIEQCDAKLASREEKYVKISAVDPYILTTNCISAPRESLTWSTEEIDMPSVENNSDNSDGKFELNGHSPFFSVNGIRLGNTEDGILNKDEVSSRYSAHSDMKLWSTEVEHGEGDRPNIVVNNKWEKNQQAAKERTMIEIIYVIKESLDQPKELNSELQVSTDLPQKWEEPRSQLISTSKDGVSVKEVSVKAIGSTQQQLSVGILIDYKKITIFDPGGCPSCLYEVTLFVGDSAGRLNGPNARLTMRTWLFFQGGRIVRIAK